MLSGKSIICFAVSFGQACHRQAIIPHIIGEEKEVPLARRRLPSVPITSEFRPTATTSGFTRPSAVFPTEENGASSPLLLTAPTVIIFSASPGGVIFFHEPAPEFIGCLRSFTRHQRIMTIQVTISIILRRIIK